MIGICFFNPSAPAPPEVRGQRGGDDEFGGFVGIGIQRESSVTAWLTVAGSVCTSVITTSDRNQKDGFEDVDAREVLEKVAAMPITRWHHKENAEVPHVGPVAQDFYAAFGVGIDDKHITTGDADGIALAAIQGLKEVVNEKDVRIEELEERTRDLTRLSE